MRRLLLLSACAALATIVIIGTAQAGEACVPHPSATVHHTSVNGALISHVETSGFCDPLGAIAMSMPVFLADAQMPEVQAMQVQVRRLQMIQLQLAMDLPTVCESVRAKQDGWCALERPPMKRQDRLPMKAPTAEVSFKR